MQLIWCYPEHIIFGAVKIPTEIVNFLKVFTFPFAAHMSDTLNQILVGKTGSPMESSRKIKSEAHSLVHLSYWKSNQKMKLEV